MDEMVLRMRVTVNMPLTSWKYWKSEKKTALKQELKVMEK